MMPSVILKGRVMLSNENNYFDKMFEDSSAQGILGGTDGETQADDAGLYAGFQALLTLA